MRHMGEPESDTWAALVRRHRERLQMTQQQLADAVGMTRESVGRHESGKLRPSYDNADKIIRALGIDRESGLRIAGYGTDDEVDPYAYVREMGLDPSSRVVRRILALHVDESLRDRMLRREAAALRRDEQRRLDDLEANIDLLDLDSRERHGGTR